MEALRMITTVKNDTISFADLKKYDNKKVEVIIFPIDDEIKTNTNRKQKFLIFKGAMKSGFSDTSKNVDELIYGK